MRKLVYAILMILMIVTHEKVKKELCNMYIQECCTDAFNFISLFWMRFILMIHKYID